MILCLEDELGTFEPGKLADSSGRRSADSPAALRRVRVFVKEGAIVHREGR